MTPTALADLIEAVTDAESARMLVRLARRKVNDAGDAEVQARAAFADACAVASRHMSVRAMARETGLDSGYLHREMAKSDLYRPEPRT